MAAMFALAACGGGGDGAVVEGTFAPGLLADGAWIVESERGERADSSGFRVADLSPGPASIRLTRGGDTAAVLNVSGLPPGARLRLRGLAVDGESGFAFPRSVELDGADVVTVNGIRFGPAHRIPREVDVRAAVLAWSPDEGALLVRPDDAGMPDLRVIVGLATEAVGTDGGGADPAGIRAGDSLRVEGSSEEGYVVASRLTLPTRIGVGDEGEVGDDARGDDGGQDEDGPAEQTAGRSVVRQPGGGSGAAAAPVRRVEAVRDDDRGRGNARGRGGGKGKGKDKKPD